MDCCSASSRHIATSTFDNIVKQKTFHVRRTWFIQRPTRHRSSCKTRFSAIHQRRIIGHSITRIKRFHFILLEIRSMACSVLARILESKVNMVLNEIKRFHEYWDVKSSVALLQSICKEVLQKEEINKEDTHASFENEVGADSLQVFVIDNKVLWVDTDTIPELFYLWRHKISHNTIHKV